MQGYHLFEYATIRLIPKVERGEFINIGIILYCSNERFLQSIFHWDEPRILSLFPDVDIPLIKKYSESFEQICKGSSDGSGIAAFAIAERFRWLVATRSTIIQTSPVHTGYTQHVKATFEKLYNELVKLPS